MFSYTEAFERNLGLISKSEQEVLRTKCVAIAGCGGVGGVHAHALARLGIGKFKLTDPDEYSVANFNRQIGANMQTIDRNKAEVMGEVILSINPDAIVEVTTSGVTADNVSSFVKDADLIIDGIDFFTLGPRRDMFKSAWKLNTPAMTAAPLGFSGTLHIFSSSGMSFDEYFDLNDEQNYYDQIVNFLLGLAPSALHLPYMDLSGVDPKTGRGPSSVVGVQMASCLIAAQAVKILLNRENILPAPHYVQFDAYRLKSKKGYLIGGNKNWLQQLKRRILLRKFKQLGLDKAFQSLVSD